MLCVVFPNRWLLTTDNIEAGALAGRHIKNIVTHVCASMCVSVCICQLQLLARCYAALCYVRMQGTYANYDKVNTFSGKIMQMNVH